jgi:hypothetical protein
MWDRRNNLHLRRCFCSLGVVSSRICCPASLRIRILSAMPRQPLSTLTGNRKLNDPIMIGPHTFAKRPDLAHLVCGIITGWAKVEGCLSLVFARYTRARVDVAMNIYNNVDAFRAQEQMLEGAARAALSDDDFFLYQASMKFIKRQYSVRNEMAHWLWGSTDDLPDALIIMEPVSHRKAHTMMFGANTGYDIEKCREYWAESQNGTFVYRKADLESHAKQMFKAEILSDRLQFLAAKPPQNDVEGRSHLLSDPEIRRDYEKLRSDATKP